jgi:putative solute:sodium symporter small subunit
MIRVKKMDAQKAQAYWKENITTIMQLMAVWFVVSYGCGILFVDLLDTIQIAGFKLGFWFAQQGSMYVFMILIFIYAKRMNAIDEKYDVTE